MPIKLYAMLLSFLVGYISLSQEILWIRLFGFANQSTPAAFAFVLTSFLFGIALGAWIGRKVCERVTNLVAAVGFVMLGCGVLDLLLPWIYVWFEAQAPLHSLGFICIFLTAAGKSIIFPIAHHLGSEAAGERVARSVSRVYLCNVLGATLGPLVTGYVLMDKMPAQHAFALMALLSLMIAAWWLMMSMPRVWLYGMSGVLVFAIASMFVPNTLLVRVATHTPQHPTKTMIENRNGVLHMLNDPERTDIVYGGNVYDGRTNLDIYLNSNGIHRAVILGAIQPTPKRVLMIGLSTGAWLRIVGGFPGVEKIDVVEINPGYMTAISDYEELRLGVQDKRVNMVVDDGRRWLRQQTNSQYDLIIMNTTWAWRAYTTNLLSAQFMQVLAGHLASGGVIAFNSTTSPDALKTASTVFTHAYRWDNFVYASQQDFRARLTDAQAATRMKALKIGADPLFFDPAQTDQHIAAFQRIPFKTVAQVEQETGRPLEVITDENLLPEYKYGKSLFAPRVQ